MIKSKTKWGDKVPEIKELMKTKTRKEVAKALDISLYHFYDICKRHELDITMCKESDVKPRVMTPELVAWRQEWLSVLW